MKKMICILLVSSAVILLVMGCGGVNVAGTYEAGDGSKYELADDGKVVITKAVNAGIEYDDKGNVIVEGTPEEFEIDGTYKVEGNKVTIYDQRKDEATATVLKIQNGALVESGSNVRYISK